MKKFKNLFFLTFIIIGWWCENRGSFHSSFRSQDTDSMLQIQDNFCFIFKQVKEILMNLKGQSLQSIFSEKILEGPWDIYHAYCCFKIGHQPIRQKVESCIHEIDNKKVFLNYFNHYSRV